MIKNLLIFILLAFIRPLYAQVVLDDNETASPLVATWSSGQFQRGIDNPSKDAGNNSNKVSKLTRSKEAYDVLNFTSKALSSDVSAYLTVSASAPKIKIDFYSAHPGTVIDLVLANSFQASEPYPKGRLGVFSATTTKSNAWETLEFNFNYFPDEETSPLEIDQFALQIDPGLNSSGDRTYYFDNFRGPQILNPVFSNTLYDDGDLTLAAPYFDPINAITRQINNPAKNPVNSSDKVVRFENKEQSIITITPTEPLINIDKLGGNKTKMKMDFYSAYPNTPVVIILSNKKISVGNDFPKGRHSLYRAYTTKTNEWETLEFTFIERPDIYVPDLGIDLIEVIVGNYETDSRTYYIDNFYGPEVFVPSGTLNLKINEVMTSNSTTIRDFQGDQEDWIEIYNSGDGTGNLKGYYLSDDASFPNKYKFPDAFIKPGQHLIIWASEKDTVSPRGEVHTNFSFSKEDKGIRLSNPSGEAIDYVEFAAMNRDISYGRKQDNNLTWTYFNPASPGAPNTTRSADNFISSLPSFSLKGGFYQDKINLTLTNPLTNGSVIRYTTDGSEPNENSKIYTGALVLANNSKSPNKLSNIRTTFVNFIPWFSPSDTTFKVNTIRARIFHDGAFPGPVVTNTYLIEPGIKTRYNVPVWSLVTDSVNLFDNATGIYIPGQKYDAWAAKNPEELVDGGTPANYNQKSDDWERKASVEYFEPNGTYGFRRDVGIRIHGGWARGNKQKSLEVSFSDKFDSLNSVKYTFIKNLKRKYRGTEITEYNNLLLTNSGEDNSSTLLRDALAHKLISHTNVATQSFRPSILFLNGEYWGIHTMREKIDGFYIQNHFNADRKNVGILTTNGTLVEGFREDEENYRALLDEVVYNNIEDSLTYHSVQQKMDVNNYIDYQVAEIFYDNRDWPVNNIMFWRNRNGNPNTAAPGLDGRWRWILVDVDYGFGLQGDPSNNTLVTATEEGKSDYPNPDWSTQLLRNLLKNQNFKKEFINRFADHLNSSFKTERVLSYIDTLKTDIEPLMEEHSNRWQSPYDVFGWERSVEEMKDFARVRPRHTRDHLNTFFTLTGTSDLTLNVNNKAAGELKINSLRINKNLPAVTAAIYPWTGTYFKTVPVKIIAIPNQGYKFVGWNGKKSVNNDTTVTLRTALTLTAYFEPVNENDLYPVAHAIKSNPFTFNSWDANSEPGTYPASMTFLQSSVKDPGLTAPMKDRYNFRYNLDTKTRIEGLYENGIAFVNTGTSEDLLPLATGRDLGSAIVAIDTRNIEKATVSFTAGTILPNSGENAIRLQYRVGSTGAFQDITINDLPVEYTKNQANHSTDFSGIALPAEALNQPYIQLRWVYHYISGAAGERAKLRLDNIKIEELIPDGVEDSKLSAKLVLFPNPTDGNLSLTLDNNYSGLVNYSMTDLSGKVIMNGTFNKLQNIETWRVENNNTTPGIYLLKWSAGNFQGIERFVIVSSQK